MNFLLIIIFILVFIRSIFYAFYEMKENSNIFGGISVIILALIGLIIPIIFI